MTFKLALHYRFIPESLTLHKIGGGSEEEIKTVVLFRSSLALHYLP